MTVPRRRMIKQCFEKCVDHFHDSELSLGENTCLDRCLAQTRYVLLRSPTSHYLLHKRCPKRTAQSCFYFFLLRKKDVPLLRAGACCEGPGLSRSVLHCSKREVSASDPALPRLRRRPDSRPPACARCVGKYVEGQQKVGETMAKVTANMQGI